MKYSIRSAIIRFCAFVVILAMCVSITPIASATTIVEPRASNYLSSYNAYIYPAALGKIQVWFTVTGVNYMDDIGTLTIQIFESTDQVNWTWVKTYTHRDTSSMLGYDKISYSSHVEYKGTVGRYYKAYVCIWAGKDGGGDTRYMWTQPKKATLFAS